MPNSEIPSWSILTELTDGGRRMPLAISFTRDCIFASEVGSLHAGKSNSVFVFIGSFKSRINYSI